MQKCQQNYQKLIDSCKFSKQKIELKILFTCKKVQKINYQKLIDRRIDFFAIFTPIQNVCVKFQFLLLAGTIFRTNNTIFFYEIPRGKVQIWFCAKSRESTWSVQIQIPMTQSYSLRNVKENKIEKKVRFKKCKWDLDFWVECEIRNVPEQRYYVRTR